MAEIFIPDLELNGRWAVTARELSKQFGEQFAVQDLSFQVPYGKIFGFIGPSGCGKTTTIRLLTGIYRPTSGEVEVLGVQPRNFGGRIRSQIGYMPQLFFLYPDFKPRGKYELFSLALWPWFS